MLTVNSMKMEELAMIRDNALWDAAEKKRRAMKKADAKYDLAYMLRKKTDIPMCHALNNVKEYLDNKSKIALLTEEADVLNKNAMDEFLAACKEAHAAFYAGVAALKK